MTLHHQLESRKSGIVSYIENRVDPSSGQCFAELTVRARAPRRLTVFNPTEREVYRNRSGCSSLEAIALRQFLRCIEDVTPETSTELVEWLHSVPWTVGGRAWEAARSMETLKSPLAVWSAFTEAYPDEQGVGYYCASENDPAEALPYYFARMNSNNFTWLTCLTITDHYPRITFRKPEIINLSALRNLVALDIGSSATLSRNELVDDSVLRAWSRHVEEVDSFPALQVMVIRNQAGVTSAALPHLNAFPSLVLFGIQNCFPIRHNEEALASSIGWTSRDDYGIVAQMQREMTRSQSWDAPIRACFNASTVLLRQQPPTHSSATPLLNFRLGHIPKDILFPCAFAPLIFFRCLRYTLPPAPSSIVPVFTTTTTTAAIAIPPSSKRRKLRRQIDLQGSLFDEMVAASAPDTPTATAPDPTIYRPRNEMQGAPRMNSGDRENGCADATQELQRRSQSVTVGTVPHLKLRGQENVAAWDRASEGRKDGS